MVEGKVASTNARKRILGKSELKTGSRNATPLAQPPKPEPTTTTLKTCPECGSHRICKDGLRYGRSNQPIQRFLCRACGYRFSEPQVEIYVNTQVSEGLKPRKNHLHPRISPLNIAFKKLSDRNPFSFGEDVASHKEPSSIATVEKRLNNLPFYNRNHQVCVSENEAKNLVSVETRQEQTAGVTKTPKLDPATLKGKLVEFAFWLSKQGYDEDVALNRAYLMKRLVNLGANLWMPETVKDVLAKQRAWTESYKMLVVYAYESFLKMEGLSWQRPNYKQGEAFPFIPTEAELDQLISACGKKVGTFLQGLKDTGADPGELAALQWIDINMERRTVQIRPVKGHNARVLSVTHQFVDRLAQLPKTSERIFKQENLEECFWAQRKRAASKFANPRLLKISFTTFRHWKGTMEYHRTKDILYVKKILGHKRIDNTLKYIDLEAMIFEASDDQFHVKVASTIQEACALVEVGFEYVTGEYNDGGKIFRKRK